MKKRKINFGNNKTYILITGICVFLCLGILESFGIKVYNDRNAEMSSKTEVTEKAERMEKAEQTKKSEQTEPAALVLEKKEITSENVSTETMAENGTAKQMREKQEVSFCDNNLEDLFQVLEVLTEQADGKWHIYVKDLSSDTALAIGNEPVCAASLIKLFVMQKTYQDYALIVVQDVNYSGDEQSSKEKIEILLESMIEWSDNESYNELMRMMSSQRVFSESCEIMNGFLEEAGYEATRVYHTLQPSETEDEGISNEPNSTSVADCAYLLESIYRNHCVSEEASASMLKFLVNQQVTHKIPAGVPEGVIVANKTGETDEVQHDAAIVYGPVRDYILCVMSEEFTDSEAAVQTIQEISSIVYAYMEEVENITFE